jgi:hypothetical protein
VIDKAQLEAVMVATLETDDTEAAIALAGYDYDDVGLMCGRFAKSALEELGIEREAPRYREYGEVITTAILAAVEVVIRAKP